MGFDEMKEYLYDLNLYIRKAEIIKGVMTIRSNKKQLVFGLCIAFVLLGAFAGVVSAKTIYAPDNYTAIQQAVNNSTAGNTITFILAP